MSTTDGRRNRTAVQATTATTTSDTRSPTTLSPMANEPRQAAAATTIQSAFRQFAARKQLARRRELAVAGNKAYESLRVYHGTHEDSAGGILSTGLKPQGAEGLSGLIGDTRRSSGKVFYTRDKEQAAYYAKSMAGIEQVNRIQAANKADDEDAIDDAMSNPVKPTVLRALLPAATQRQAIKDEKGGDQDYILAASVPPGLMLPGHLEPNADLARRQPAVQLFQSELLKHGVRATPAEALETLSRRRRLSISGSPSDSVFGKIQGDSEALRSKYAVDSARETVDRYKYNRGIS